MLLSIPTSIDLRGPVERRAHVCNFIKRMKSLKFMRTAGVRILGA